MTSENTFFYENLPAIGDFGKVADFKAYRPAPEDWHLVFVDIKNSGQAIKNGKYKEVNVLGASVIAAVSNCYEPVSVPYIFEGDGTVIGIPPDRLEEVHGILAYIRDLATEQFGLTLRVGTIPVKTIRDRGKDVKIAKFKVSDHFTQAGFSGGGIVYTEEYFKEEPESESRLLSKQQKRIQPDLSTLECRWENQESRYDEIITLMVRATSPNEGEMERTYHEVIRKVHQIYCEELICHPVQSEQLRLTFRRNKLRIEQKIKTFGKGWWDNITYSIRLYLYQVIGKIFFYFGIRTGETDWSKYKKDLQANSDYRKFDDALYQVLTGTVKNRQQLIDYLEEEYRKGKLAYGISVSPAITITCLVNRYQNDHFHFIDGSEGGYADAARQLKERLRRKPLREE